MATNSYLPRLKRHHPLLLGDQSLFRLPTPLWKVSVTFYIIANVNADGAIQELLTINNTTAAVPQYIAWIIMRRLQLMEQFSMARYLLQSPE